jgi:predicted nuclease of restriction endonuclease-like RecB superfamily
MLPTKFINVRHARDRIIPCLIDVQSPELLEQAELLIKIYQQSIGTTRGMIDEQIVDYFGEEKETNLPRALAHLLDERCVYVTASFDTPQTIRDRLFLRAAQQRKSLNIGATFNRDELIRELALEYSVPDAYIEQSLFADLPGEQVLSEFKALQPIELLQLYNLSLVQSIMLRSTSIDVVLRDNSIEWYRRFFQMVKFYRLIVDLEQVGDSTYRLTFDGPMSLFAATTRYGLQIANLLPLILQSQAFELKATLAWGPTRKKKWMLVDPDDNLVAGQIDDSQYMPQDLQDFYQLFQKKIHDIEIVINTDLISMRQNIWLPDFKLIHKHSGSIVYLELLGYWRRANLERRLQILQQCDVRWLLAISRSLHTDKHLDLASHPNVYLYRSFPSVDEIAQCVRDRLSQN